MPSRASTSLLLSGLRVLVDGILHVSMPSRASTSLLHHYEINFLPEWGLCQCPHGLMPHFYRFGGEYRHGLMKIVSMPSRAYASFLLSRMFEIIKVRDKFGVNALTGLCLISTYMYSMSI